MLITILEELRKQISCLNTNGFWYMDLKLRNIMYRYVKGKLRMLLVDVGSMVPKNGFYIATYPPPESFLSESHPKVGLIYEGEVTYAMSVWIIGIVALQLVEQNEDIYSEHLSYRNIKNTLNKSPKWWEQITSFKGLEEYPALRSYLTRCLSISPDDRPNLDYELNDELLMNVD